jgi:hypothetical protein
MYFELDGKGNLVRSPGTGIQPHHVVPCAQSVPAVEVPVENRVKQMDLPVPQIATRCWSPIVDLTFMDEVLEAPDWNFNEDGFVDFP